METFKLDTYVYIYNIMVTFTEITVGRLLMENLAK